MARPYCIYDVFTDKKLCGNPLAIVFDAGGLDDEAMQAIAGEFNLSETVFVFPSVNPTHLARIRIFTRQRELPFAGHPTVGTAVALAERAHEGRDRPLDIVSVLDEKIGPVRCAVSLRDGEVGFAEFDLPKTSVELHFSVERQAIADAIGLPLSDLCFGNHVPSIWSAGVPILLVPVNSLASVEAVDFDPQLWERTAPFCEGALTSAYVYCRGGVHHAAHFHARKFSPDLGIEDPATGSAVAALSGAIERFDGLSDGHHPMLVEQGVEMGRPSFIHLHIDCKEGKVFRARIGGRAVRLASGILDY